MATDARQSAERLASELLAEVEAADRAGLLDDCDADFGARLRALGERIEWVELTPALARVLEGTRRILNVSPFEVFGAEGRVAVYQHGLGFPSDPEQHADLAERFASGAAAAEREQELAALRDLGVPVLVAQEDVFDGESPRTEKRRENLIVREVGPPRHLVRRALRAGGDEASRVYDHFEARRRRFRRIEHVQHPVAVRPAARSRSSRPAATRTRGSRRGTTRSSSRGGDGGDDPGGDPEPGERAHHLAGRARRSRR